MKALYLSIVFTILLFPALAYADAVSCDGGIVSSGDSSAVLTMKCGQPEWKESQTEEIAEHLDRDTKRTTHIMIEDWTYNFGPDRLVRTVTLRNGTVVGIRTYGYGY